MAIQCKFNDSDKKRIASAFGISFEEVWKKAEENLRKAGCSEKGMQFVLNDEPGIYNAFEANYGSQAKYFGTDLEGRVTEYMTTD